MAGVGQAGSASGDEVRSLPRGAFDCQTCQQMKCLADLGNLADGGDRNDESFKAGEMALR